MKVHIEYTVDVNDDIRLGINKFYGDSGLATRNQIKRWYEANGKSMDLDLAWSLDDDD